MVNQQNSQVAGLDASYMMISTNQNMCVVSETFVLSWSFSILENDSVLHSQTVFNCFGLAPDLYFFVPLFAASAKAGRLSEMVSRMSAKISGRSQESPKSPSDSSPLMNSKLILNALFVAALAVAWRYIYLEWQHQKVS